MSGRLLSAAPVATLVAAVVTVSLAMDARNWATPPDPVVIRVESVDIRRSAVASRLESLHSVHEPQGTNVDWRDKLLESLVEDAIIQLYARRGGISVPRADLEYALARVKMQFPTRTAFQTWLRDTGLDERELRRRVHLQTLASRVYLDVTKSVRIGEPEILGHYERNMPVDAAGEPVPLLEVRAEIEEILLRQARADLYAEWLRTQRLKADVEVLDPSWRVA